MSAPPIAEAMRAQDFHADPYPLWRRMRDEAPVFRMPGTRAWYLTRYHDVVDVFRDGEGFSNRLYKHSLGEVFGPTMLEMDGMDHVVRRSVVAPEFVGKRLESFRPVIERNAAALVDRFAGRGCADLVDELTTRLPVNVIVDMLGMDQRDHDRFHAWYQAMMVGLDPEPGLRAAGITAHGELSAHVEPLIGERRQCPVSDLLSRLVHAEVDGHRLDDTELKAFISLLLTAGGETTDKAMANMWWNLLQDGEQLDLVKADPSAFSAAFAETMRHSPSVLYQTRYVVTDFERHGQTIPAGSAVILCLASGNRDETVFREPDRFRLDRPDLRLALELRSGGIDRDGRAGHLGFGVGKHFCLGYELARTESVIGSQLLLERAPDIALDGPPPAMRNELPRAVTRSVPRLAVRFTPHAPEAP